MHENGLAVKNFFAFTAKMFADKASFRLLPESGCPASHGLDSTLRQDRRSHRTPAPSPYSSASDLDKRLEFMRAIPFAAFQHDVHIATPVGPYDEDAVGLRILSEGMMHKHVPPHIVGLTAVPVNGYSVFLNTQLGIVWWHEAANELISLTPFTVIGTLAR